MVFSLKTIAMDSSLIPVPYSGINLHMTVKRDSHTNFDQTVVIHNGGYADAVSAKKGKYLPVRVGNVWKYPSMRAAISGIKRNNSFSE